MTKELPDITFDQLRQLTGHKYRDEVPISTADRPKPNGRAICPVCARRQVVPWYDQSYGIEGMACVACGWESESTAEDAHDLDAMWTRKDEQKGKNEQNG